MATTVRSEEAGLNAATGTAERPITAEGFNHLHINVRDLARSIRF